MNIQEMSKPDLIKLAQDLTNEVSRATSIKNNLQSIEEFTREQKRTLDERVKELACVYEAIRTFRRIDLSDGEKVQAIAELLPSAMQYPAAACARIIENEREFKTAMFDASSPWRLSSGILAAGKFVGLVEVRYLKEFPMRDEGPFLTEEQALVRILAEIIGLAMERRLHP